MAVRFSHILMTVMGMQLTHVLHMHSLRLPYNVMHSSSMTNGIPSEVIAQNVLRVICEIT